MMGNQVAASTSLETGWIGAGKVTGDMALRCYTSGLQKAMMAMKRRAQQNLEHLQKELQHERNVSNSLRETWVNSKKGLQQVGEMTVQLQ